MAINTLITLKDAISQFVNDHEQLQRVQFESDDYRSASITEGDEFPMLFVAPLNVQMTNVFNLHTIRIYVYARINDDRSDVWENANDTSLILRDIKLWWNTYNDSDITIQGEPTGEFKCNAELDNLVGYYSDFIFEVPSHSICNIPINATPVPSPICLPATSVITDTDGNVLETVTIQSGLTENTQIQNSTYIVEYLNGTPIESGDILAEGSVLVQVANPIVCDDVTININGNLWDTVPSGGTENIQVRQSSGSTQIGAIQGQYFRIADSVITINTTEVTANVSATDPKNFNLLDLEGNPITVNSVSGDNVTLNVVDVPKLIADMFEGRVLFDNGTFEAKQCLINELENLL